MQYLLLDLLKDVLHLHHDNLHLALVTLAAKGVNLTSHLLGNETEFFAHARIGYWRLDALRDIGYWRFVFLWGFLQGSVLWLVACCWKYAGGPYMNRAKESWAGMFFELLHPPNRAISAIYY